jgi:hypothetical protein
MNKAGILAVSLFSAATLVPLSASADTFSGTINGISCAHTGKVCPQEPSDPHIAAEMDFVLMVGDDHYLLPNLPRDVKVRHVLREVQVVGDLDPKYHSIDVQLVRARSDSGYRKVWSQEDQRAVWSGGTLGSQQ